MMETRAISEELEQRDALRHRALHDLAILESVPAIEYEDAVQIAAHIAGAPFAFMNLLGAREQRIFVSSAPLDGVPRCMPNEQSLCSHTLTRNDIFVLQDLATHADFMEHPALIEKGIRFYAGYPIHAGEPDIPLGALCVIDFTSRAFPAAQQSLLASLARQISSRLALRAATLRLEASARAKRRFINTLTHELRAPVSAMRGYAEMLAEDLEGQDVNQETREDAEALQRAGVYLSGLIDESLDYARIEAGQIELALDSVSLATVIEEVHALVVPLAARRGNRLDVEIEGASELVVEADAKRLKQVLINLVGNAAKFCRAGVITLRARGELGDAAIVEVSDTGVGIEPEHMEGLFDPFSRAHAGQGFKGTGLGLSISRDLIERMGGRIEVESEPGEGTTFRVRFAQSSSALGRTGSEYASASC